MRIAPWRLALTGGAVLVLAVAGIGLVQATSPTPSQGPAAAAPTDPGQRALPAWARRIGGWRALVHADVTLDRPKQGLVTFDLDHGTVQSVGGSSLTILEAGGQTVTLATDAQTKVRRDGEPAKLSDLRAGDDAYVISRVPAGGGTPLAARIVVPRARAGASAPAPSATPST